MELQPRSPNIPEILGGRPTWTAFLVVQATQLAPMYSPNYTRLHHGRRPVLSWMSLVPDENVTAVLIRLRNGEEGARDQLLGLLYGDLYRRAERVMHKQGLGHTLQPTALVNEAYLKLLGPGDPAFADKGHFLAVASQAMGQIVIDHARSKNRIKNSAPGQRVTLDGLVDSFEQNAVDLIALGDALEELKESHPDLLDLVQLRFFGALTMDEIAGIRDVPKRSCERDWAFARNWLRKKMSDPERGAR
tara:strand:+ start:4847 stop:5587 length:741 start_codon:yes stop_codon:yes gene_type:complete